QPSIDFSVCQSDVFTTLGIVGGIEAAADVALIGPFAGIPAISIVEMREVRQVGDVGHQALYPRLEGLPDVGPALSQVLIDLVADLNKNADQMGNVAARVVDV